MPIPKRILQTWIGPLPPPVKWMETWKRLNPDWEYRLVGNEELHGRKWRNQRIVDHYLRRCEEVRKAGRFVTEHGAVFTGEKATLFAWHVIADVLRYEILLEEGGYMPGADTECLAPIPDRAFEGAKIYMVNTGHLYAGQERDLWARLCDGGLAPADAVRFRRYDPLACAPVMASVAGHPFLELAVKELGRLKAGELREAVDTTGNVFMARLIRQHPETLDGVVIRPYQRERDAIVEGSWRIHHSGTTHCTYKYGRKAGI